MRPAEQFRYLVLAAQREGNRMLAAALREMGLTPAWAEAIVILREGEPLTVRQLGDLLVCEGDHPSRLVSRMVQAGLIVGSPSPSDRRALDLRLSPAARALVPRILAVERQVYDYLEQALPAGDLTAAIAVLRAIVAGLPAGVALERRIEHQAGGTGAGSPSAPDHQ